MSSVLPRAKTFQRGVGAFALAALCLIFLAACGKSKTAEEYLHNAQDHLAHGDVMAAIIDLKNALQKDPKYLQARVLLGQSYVDLSDGVSGEAELLHARQDGAGPDLVAKPLAEAELILGKRDAVLKETEAMPPNASPALKASLLSLRGQAQLGLGRAADAQNTLEAALKEDPNSIDALTGMVRYFLARRDIPSARTQLVTAEKAAPGTPKVLILKGTVDIADRKFADAEQAFEGVLKAQPWNLVARINLARAQIAGDKLKEADANLAVVAKSAPNDPHTNYLRALVAYRQKDFTNAKNFCQRVLSANKDYVPALLLMGATSYALGQPEQANTYLNQYIFQVPQSVEGRKLLAAVQLQLGHAGEAVKTLSPAAKGSADVQLLTMIGTAAARSGDFEQANRYLAEAVEKQPDNSALRAQLGVTDVALGKTDSGISELEKASQQDPNALNPAIALILAYIRNKDLDKALAAVNQLKERHPKEAVSYDLGGVVHAARKELDEAKADFLKAREIQPGDPNALRNLALLATRENKLDLAAQYYKEILDKNPDNVVASIDLAELEAKTGELAKSRATLEQAINRSPDNPAPRLVLARLLLLEGKNDEVLKVLDPALQRAPREPALLEVAGRAQLAAAHLDAAISTFKTLAEAAPQSGMPHRYLANAYAARKDYDTAITEAKQAVQLEPKDIANRWTLATVYIAKQNYGDARGVVDELLKEAPKDPSVVELNGLLWMAQGKTAEAEAAFQEALALANNNVFRVRLAQTQAKLDHVDEATKTLLPWIEEHPTDVIARMAMGDIFMQAKRPADARAQYEEIVKQDPKNVVAENNLAWTLAQLNQPKEALDHARRAAAAAPDAPDVLDTLGVVLMRNGDSAEAVKTLGKAAEKAPNNAAIQFHFGQALVSVGEKDKARDVLKKALASGQAFDERDQAQKLLQGL